MAADWRVTLWQVGEVNGGPDSSLISNIGIDFTSWTDSSGLAGGASNSALNSYTVDGNHVPAVRDGAIFWMDPGRTSANVAIHTNRRRATVGQLTLRDTLIDNGPPCDRILRLNAQGKHPHHGDWKETGFRWRRCDFQNAKDSAARVSTPRTCPSICANSANSG